MLYVLYEQIYFISRKEDKADRIKMEDNRVSIYDCEKED
jgi:hypothetical protein